MSADGIHADPEKNRAVIEWPVPTNVTEARAFLGLASNYRQFVKNFAVKSGPLRRLLQRDQEFLWI